MLTIIRKIIFHLVAIALKAWQTELINRLELKDKKRKEVTNEETKKTSEESE